MQYWHNSKIAFGFNTIMELKNITATSEITDKLHSQNTPRQMALLSDVK